jgi:hypothetical protein
MPSDEDDLWRKLVIVHNHVKELVIFAEELDIESETFVQPFLEQRSALDHVMRCQAAKFGVRTDAPEGYAQKNLDKALGHLYRTFFDVADWICISIKIRLAGVLEPYSNEALQSVMPDYYTTVRPGIEALTIAIARIRNAKDIGDADILREVEEYNAKIHDLIAFHETLTKHVPALEEWRKKDRGGKLWDRLFDLAKVLIGAILGYLAALLKK